MASVPIFEASRVHFVAITETKLWEKTYHCPTKLQCAAARKYKPALGGAWTPQGRGREARAGNGQIPPVPPSGANPGGREAAVGADTQEPTPRGTPLLQPLWRREGPPASLGAALLEECCDVGVQDSENVASLGAPQSRGTEISGVLWLRAGMWAQRCLGVLQKSWEHLLVTAGLEGRLWTPRVFRVGGSTARSSARMESALRFPKDSPSWPFCPQWVPSSWCLDWNSSGMRTYEAYKSPLRSPELCQGAAGLFILAAQKWGGFPSLPVVQLPALGGEHAHQPFIEACLSLGTCPAEEAIRREDWHCAPKWVKTVRSKMRKKNSEFATHSGFKRGNPPAHSPSLPLPRLIVILLLPCLGSHTIT